MPLQLLRVAATSVALLGLCQTGSAQAPAISAAPAMQTAPDLAAYKAAQAHTDSGERIAALNKFVHDYPASKRAGSARNALFGLLLKQEPRDEKRIHQLAKERIDAAPKDERAGLENDIAYDLAEALPNGVDLKSAETWSRDAVKQTTLASITAMMGSGAKPAKPLSAEEQAKRDARIKEVYSEMMASYQQTLADVYLHEGKLAEARSTISQAQALDPLQGSNYLTLGQIQHAEHQDDKAMENLETAVAYGGMTPAGQDLLKTLYAAQHGGNAAGLDEELDRRYRTLLPTAAPKHHAVAGSGRTVLLSLFTGSGCDPCVSADLATDDVLASYPRDQVVVLAFDQHIPKPDPLANPSTVARATYDGVHFTPTFRIDGVEGPQLGGPRKEAAEGFESLSAALDKELAVPSRAKLHLSASQSPDGTIRANARLQVTDAAALAKLLAAQAAKPATTTSSEGTKASSTSTSASQPDKQPKLVLNFALVQREVRYSGENGIRFHAMVVRDVAKPTADGFPVALTGSTSAAAVFDPKSISTALSQYLAEYSKHNERFGTAHFLSTDTSLPPNDLAVAAWAEDLTSHQVVAAAYAPIDSVPANQQASR